MVLIKCGTYRPLGSCEYHCLVKGKTVSSSVCHVPSKRAGGRKRQGDFPHGCYGNAAFPKCGRSVVGLFFDSEPQFPTLLRAQDEIQNENQHLAQLLGAPLVLLPVFRTWWLISFPRPLSSFICLCSSPLYSRQPSFVKQQLSSSSKFL